jgi:hypothetical protein
MVIGFLQREDPILHLIATLQAAGFIPIPTHADNPKALAYRDGYRRFNTTHWKSGMGVAIRLGQQPDGSWLILIDLDSHTPDQCAERALFTLRGLVGNTFAKCVLKRSTSGSGYHIIIRSPEPPPHNQRLYVDGKHVGELGCQGGHCPIVGAFLHGDLTTLSLLTAEEWAVWRSALALQCGTRNPITWTARARKMLYVTRGAVTINTRRFRCADGMPRAFEGTDRRHKIAQATAARRMPTIFSRWRSWPQTPTAPPLTISGAQSRLSPSRTAQRLRKRAMTSRRILPPSSGAFSIAIPAPVAPDSSVSRSGPNPTRRPFARAVDRAGGSETNWRRSAAFYAATRRGRFECIRTRTGLRNLTVAVIAQQLHVSVRTTQRYLQQLRQQGEIACQAVVGRHGRLIVTLLPRFDQPQPAESEGH